MCCKIIKRSCKLRLEGGGQLVYSLDKENIDDKVNKRLLKKASDFSSSSNYNAWKEAVRRGLYNRDMSKDKLKKQNDN